MGKEYTTTRGVTVTFCGIAMLLDKLQAAYPPPDPPTYEVELPGTLDPKTQKPRTEKHFHDATTLETEEDKQAWAEYELRRGAVVKRYSEALMRLVFLRGIRYPKPAEDWMLAQTACGIEVPEDPIERQLHYVETEVIGDAEDIGAIMSGVMEASGTPEEVLTGIRDSFRDSLGYPQPAHASNGTSDVQRVGLDVQYAVRADQDRDPQRSSKGQ
jgi:hypothetical protein